MIHRVARRDSFIFKHCWLMGHGACEVCENTSSCILCCMLSKNVFHEGLMLWCIGMGRCTDILKCPHHVEAPAHTETTKEGIAYNSKIGVYFNFLAWISHVGLNRDYPMGTPSMCTNKALAPSILASQTHRVSFGRFTTSRSLPRWPSRGSRAWWCWPSAP